MIIDIDEQDFLKLIKKLLEDKTSSDEILRKYESIALKFNSAPISSTFIRIPGCRFNEHQDVITNSRDAKCCADIVDVNGVDTVNIKSIVLNSMDKDAIITCAIIFYNKGLDVSDFDKRIVQLKNPAASCEFCEKIQTANIPAHEAIVKNSKNAKLCADFIIKVKNGIDSNDLLDVIMKSGEYEYLVEVASNNKLLDIENIRRYVLLKIIKNKNPAACYLYAMNVKDANKVLLLNIALMNPDPRYNSIKERCKEELSYEMMSRDELEQAISEYCRELKEPKKVEQHRNYF